MFNWFKKGKEKVQGFAVKQLMKRQMKNVPPEQQEVVMKAVEENPQFFQKIAEEVQHKMKHEGKNQMAATMEVMRKHQAELMQIMGGKQ